MYFWKRRQYWKTTCRINSFLSLCASTDETQVVGFGSQYLSCYTFLPALQFILKYGFTQEAVLYTNQIHFKIEPLIWATYRSKLQKGMNVLFSLLNNFHKTINIVPCLLFFNIIMTMRMSKKITYPTKEMLQMKRNC